jgi:hypothetical protein
MINYRCSWRSLRSISLYSLRFERDFRLYHSEFAYEACANIRCTNRRDIQWRRREANSSCALSE